MADPSAKDQQHPQEQSDRQLTQQLLASDPSDFHLAELARLRVRYQGFPGARDIQANLDKALQRWNMTEEELFTRTREIHNSGQIYKGRSNQREDWS
jgi:hypothetical protein